MVDLDQGCIYKNVFVNSHIFDNSLIRPVRYSRNNFSLVVEVTFVSFAHL